MLESLPFSSIKLLDVENVDEQRDVGDVERDACRLEVSNGAGDDE